MVLLDDMLQGKHELLTQPCHAWLRRFLYGEADYEMYSDTPYRSKHAVATVYFILYVFTVLMLLANLLTALIMHSFNQVHDYAEKIWYLRWAGYVLRYGLHSNINIQISAA